MAETHHKGTLTAIEELAVGDLVYVNHDYRPVMLVRDDGPDGWIMVTYRDWNGPEWLARRRGRRVRARRAIVTA
jgi:hypothetical protein